LRGTEKYRGKLEWKDYLVEGGDEDGDGGKEGSNLSIKEDRGGGGRKEGDYSSLPKMVQGRDGRDSKTTPRQRGKSSTRGGGVENRGEGGGTLNVKNMNLPPMLPSINTGKVNTEMANQAKKNVLVVDREKEFGARVGHTKQDMGGLLEYPEDQIAKNQKARTQA
jgi:hypothetical protein